MHSVRSPGAAAPPSGFPPADEVVALQDGLHAALQAFLNADYVVPGSRRHELLKPLRLSAARVPWDLVSRPIASLERIDPCLDLLPDPGADIVHRSRRSGWLRFDQAAQVLSAAYTLLDAWIDAVEAGSLVDIHVLKAFDARTYLARGLTAVYRLADYVRGALSSLLDGFYLHGSLSTLDFTAYSDVDDFIVVSRDTVLNADALGNCARACLSAAHFLYDHDLLHHHRHYVVTAVDLRAYSPAYMPPEVLAWATAILGPRTIRLAPRDAGDAFRQVLAGYAKDLLGRPPLRSHNTWALKSLLSKLMLMPVLFLESRGTYCYKRFSFDLAAAAFDGSWEAVEIASAVRRAWAHSPNLRERVLKWIILERLGNPPLFEHAMRRWSQRIPHAVASTLGERRFEQAMDSFARKALTLAGEGA